jgi:signal transduction histidine kinase
MPTRKAQAVVDALPDGVVLAGPDGRVTVISSVAAQMLGVTVDCVGEPLADVLALRDQDGNAWVSHNRPYAGLSTRTAVPEQSWLLPNGEEALVAAKIHRPALDLPVSEVAVTIRSGRGRARLDRERSDLVATVAHELRSPLTGVKGFVQALLNRWDRLNDEQKRLMLTTVSADADRLTRLIAELLDVARIDTGRLQLHRRPSDAGVLTRRIVDSVSAGTARPISLDVADGLPDIHADPDKFTQVVTNLVENAVRHGEGTVTVTLAPLGPGQLGDQPGVRITVDDQGEGIPADMRLRVVTKFWKGGKRGGSGLGLYLVNGLTKVHGGTVSIEDAPGGGARIEVAWPAAAPEV